MTQTMVERVAKTLCEQWGGKRPSWEDVPHPCQGICAACRNEARAVINALREPTDEMVACLEGYEESDDEKRDGWRAAIDVAMK